MGIHEEAMIRSDDHFVKATLLQLIDLFFVLGLYRVGRWQVLEVVCNFHTPILIPHRKNRAFFAFMSRRSDGDQALFRADTKPLHFGLGLIHEGAIPHAPVRNKRFEGESKRRRAVFLDKEMPNPRKSIAADKSPKDKQGHPQHHRHHHT